MATSTYGTPYVQGSDLVSAYPTVSSSLATRVDEVSYKGNGLNAQTGTTYTLVAGDAGKTITLSNASPVAVTLPQDSTADLPDGAVVSFYNLGAGTVTISQGTGATLQGGSITLAQYEVASVIKLSANTYGRFDGAPASGLTPITPTSIANSGGTATLTGMATSFTTVTSVSMNGVFSSTYDAYRMIVEITSATAAAALNARFRTAGTDSATGYGREKLEGDGASASANSLVAQTEVQLANSSASGNFVTVDMYAPFLTRLTAVNSLHSDRNGTRAGIFGGYHSVASSYDGLTLLPSTGTITGTARIYGYRN